MGLPNLFEGNFETGDNSEWDSESDTGSLLDFPHYSELARIPGMEVPYRGAYCARIKLGDTNDHTLTAGAVNLSANDTFGTRFCLYLAADFAFTADDTFNLLELQASATIELAVGIKVVNSTQAITIGVGEVTPTVFAVPELQRGRWYVIEVDGNIDAGGGDNGDAVLRVNNVSSATIASLDQGAITDAVFGSQLTLSTTTGTILLDEFVAGKADGGRVGGITDRWSEEVYLTKTGHAFVGPGIVDNATLLSGNDTTAILNLYDTDEADSANTEPKLVLKNTAANEIVDPAGTPIFDFKRGCYVTITGTEQPRAIIKIKRAVAWGSTGAVRQYGLGR